MNDRRTIKTRAARVCEAAGEKEVGSDQEILPLGKREQRGQMRSPVCGRVLEKLFEEWLRIMFYSRTRNLLAEKHFLRKFIFAYLISPNKGIIFVFGVCLALIQRSIKKTLL